MRIRCQLSQLVLVFSLIATSLGLNTASAASVSHDDAVAIKAEIKQLVDAYGVYRDDFNAAGYASLFAEDGKFFFQGDVFEGRAVLQKRVEDADHATVYMHMMSSGHIEIIDENNATGAHYAAIYSVTPDEPVAGGGPISVPGPSVIGKYSDKYIRTEEGWRFAERSFSPVFNTAK